MGKSLVERYEQILSQDPSSSVFVELAKALLERGDSARAMAVCEAGLQHHPRSVVARVLWGKSLINLSRPAEAMEQFDQAITIDRENPHAYNLIGEVLLRKGLYRSALPLLRRAVSLQPDDTRVRQWLEQTERALTGGPAPALGDEMETVLATSFTPSGSIPVVELPPAATPPPPPADADEAQLPRAPEVAPEPPTTVSAGPPLLQPELPTVVIDPHLLAGLRHDEAGDGDEDDENTIPERTTADRAMAGVPEAEAVPLLPLKPTFSPIETPIVHEPMPGLLADIPVPDMPPPAQSLLEMPKVEVSSLAAEAIAQEYERELRDKLQATEEEAENTFWARHWLKVAVTAVLAVALGVGGWAFTRVRAKNNNLTLTDVLARAHALVQLDTREGYAEALRKLDQALDMDASSVEATALAAYTHGLMYGELGHAAEHRDQASLGLARAGVREQFPGLTLVTEYEVAGPDAQPALKRQVLTSKLEDPELQLLAGQLLLQQSDSKGAIERLRKVLDQQPNNVHAWLLLASYYRTHDDCEGALRMYTGVPAKLSPAQPERVIGAAECRLTLQRDVDVARAEIEKLNVDDLSKDQSARRALALSRAYGLTGDGAKAVALLTEESKDAPDRAFDFGLALGEAQARAGDWEAAQRSAEAALRAKPDSDEAKELVGRLLIGRDRAREVLARFPNDEGRRIRLVRATALAQLGDWKRARAELQKTQMGGKYPSEAVVLLAQADAAEGQSDRAQAVLEKALTATKRAKDEVQVALGRIYWQRGLTDKARAQFEEAAKDPDDYEAACALGRLLLSVGLADQALEPLQQAVQRDGFHGEAREALARTYVELGRPQEALVQLEAWQKDNPASPAVARDLAQVYLQLGPSRWKDADVASARALKLSPRDGETMRVRAESLFSHGDLKGGFAVLEQANKMNPKDAETFCAIGRAFLRRSNVANAQKAFDAARREGPSLACSKLGPSLVKPSGGKAMAAELGNLAEQAPHIADRALASALRARVLLGMGNLKDARAAADTATKLEPYLGEAQLVSGQIASRAREDDKAKAALEKAVEADPGDARIRLAYADELARSNATAGKAYGEYQLYLKLADHAPDIPRVKKLLPVLKKRAR